MPTAGEPVFTYKEEDIVIATDGTVKDSQGGAVYTLHSTEQPGTIRAIVPIDGLPKHMSSYRTELFGILYALLMLRGLLGSQKLQWVRLLAVLLCNNEAAVTRFNMLEGDRHFSIAGANQSDADVLQELS